MTIELKPIDENNYAAALQLDVLEDQQDLVATVTKSLADAYVYPQSLFRLAYLADQPIGYVLLFPYQEAQVHSLNIVRLMVDGRFQGQGHGRALLGQVLELVRTLQPPVRRVRISTLPHNTVALALYRSVGFVEAADLEAGEVALYLELK